MQDHVGLSKAAVWFEQLIVKSLPRSSVARALHSEHSTSPEESYNSERIWKCFAIRQPCLQAYKVLFRKNHEASIWKIILPDFLAGTCHYMRCNWLRYLSVQVKPSCEVQ